MATTITPISTQTNYNISDEILLNPSITQSSFNPGVNYIEYTITTPNNSFSTIDYDYREYSFPNSGVTSNSISDIIINPEIDLFKNGFNSGEYNVYYNFLKNELSSSFNNQNFFIKEISPDRTELILNSVDNSNIINLITDFKNQLNSNPNYFQDFYLNFGNNILCVANNININNNTLDIFINLYEPLPSNIQVKNTLWIVTQVADELAFNITTTPEPIVPIVTSFPLNGPNFNLPIKDQTNNSTEYQTYSSLITSSLLSTSYSQLNNLISSSGIQIGIDYTDFSNFTHFSSAVTRINNFYYKKQLIDKYQQEINVLDGITLLATSSNILLLTNQINNIIENFDGYEYFLYYGTGSWSYPKSGSTIPYELYPAGSPEVLAWLGDAEELTGILGSASLYDRDNLDYLYNTVPNFIQEDPQNDPYKTFVEMVAQSYDNIWIYYKDITNRYRADNRLNFGISKELVANALKSFGVKLYQNNYSVNDLYSAFLGYGNPNPSITGSLPVTANSGQEYIDEYITSSYEASVLPLDDANKELYKRLYHNLPYLAKTKGTIPGLRALINCFGIPDTILRISEFGGRDKDTSTYDYFNQVYNNAMYFGDVLPNVISSSFTLNSSWPVDNINPRPSTIQFRFKPDIEYIQTRNSQSLMFFYDSSYTSPYTASLLTLEYTGSGFTKSIYSGSAYSASYAYADLRFYPSIHNMNSFARVHLPFYNGEWWSVQLNRTSSISSDIFTLYAGSKGYYDGYDGNQILYLASSSQTATTTNTPWNGTSGEIYIGGYALDSSITIGTKNFIRYPGYFQELRYWAKTGSAEMFRDFVMNPHSIDYKTGDNEYANYLAFRAPFGSELDTFVTGSTNTSVHPKITGSWIVTESFASDSNYYIETPSSYSNVESYFYDQPIAGIRNRVTDKIQIVDSIYPSGSVLSQYRSLEQDYSVLKEYNNRNPNIENSELGSETPDINLLEVAFSPQNEINDDIIASLGYFNIGEYIGDPRQVSSSATTYPDLVNLSNEFFQKYFTSYNLFDYIRLIKYFDNSLFKMIQDFVPARTSLASGVVIKQHLLERNKYPQPQVEWEDVTYSGSIQTAFIEGSTGGTFNSYNFTGSVLPPTFINNTQSWGEEVKTPVGLLTISHSTQDEFYNGELLGSEIIATNGELNEANTIKYPPDIDIIYNPVLYISNITSESDFVNSNTSPNPGEVYLWWDSGSLTNPGNTRTVVPSKQLAASLGKAAASFLVNKTNGVKYIKLNRIDSGGLDQTPYLQQLQTIILSYPDRSDVIYNVAGSQNFGNYFLYSIGPYAPGSMNNFNTSSAGEILNYDFLIYSSSAFTLPNFPGTTPTNTTLVGGNSLGYFDTTTGYWNLGSTPNKIIQVKISGNASWAVPAGGPQIIIYNNITGEPIQNETLTGVTTGPQTNLPFNITLLLTSSYYSPIENDSISFRFGRPGAGTYTINELWISASLYNATPFDGSSSLTILDPYVPNFDYNDYNALINNAETPQISVFFMDVDYSQNPVTPVNQSLILDGGADRAQVQDSNYTSKAWSNIRYNGSKTNSYRTI